MWINEETAQARIRSSANILNRVNRSEETPADYPVIMPEVPPESIDGELTDDKGPTVAASGHIPTDEELADAAIQASMEDDTDISKSVFRQLKKTLQGRRRHLTEKEAADATIVGQLVGFKHAGAIYDRTPGHISYTSNTGERGHQPPYGRYDTPLAALIEQERTKLRNLAYSRLEHVLGCLSNEKIQKVEKARDLASIATQLATVADKMLPREMQTDDTVHFHILRPEVKQQSDYEIVEVGEERT